MTDYRQILLKEMVPALGCTEPIAIALCAAKARAVLGKEPERMDIHCSGNVIKNTKSVVVPNTGGLSGIEAAGCVGCFGGDADKGLEVLTRVGAEDIRRAKAFIRAGKVSVHHVRGEDSLYIRCALFAESDSAEAIISGGHSQFVSIKKNGAHLPGAAPQAAPAAGKVQADMTVADILTFVQGLDFERDAPLRQRIDQEIDVNMAIAEEGLSKDYGASVGKTLLESYADDPRARIRAYAAAGSDARMAGSSKPVVINSGSGNQGMTVSLPLIVYARDNNLERDKLRRGLVISNLIAIYIKKQIGTLSAFCGVVSAAAAAGAGLGYLQDLGEEAIGSVITNTLLTSGGILCDGAKASCASKISVSLDNAMLAIEMVKRNRSLPAGQGLAGRTIDETISNVAAIAREGMKETDNQILEMMIRANG
ncbi:MAG: L-serine ammonia-lyase, iron-sulfur-dependent, subunit alpha [Christensenellaceae bacterium]|nr:L-serine ammonia-lyase, iron-sulfur-dependent, subunit alpha [Christensenellaceae bacterium]MEA5066293.1 L-serine ammonia-lyase, iron-sulfur-dependent, subunit alpha [Eubacteriales bacterium]MEA5068435.1 L-serine ammonia-lyase, iron-sulfur-dependent, subunit alpha [Christensenellaceae bacterium]